MGLERVESVELVMWQNFGMEREQELSLQVFKLHIIYEQSQHPF